MMPSDAIRARVERDLRTSALLERCWHEPLGGDALQAEIDKSLEGKERPKDIDGFTPEQQFFVAWSQFRGHATRPEQQKLMIQTDPHPVAKYRVIGPLSNLPEFRDAFHCGADAPMVRPADKRCEVW